MAVKSPKRTQKVRQDQPTVKYFDREALEQVIEEGMTYGFERQMDEALLEEVCEEDMLLIECAVSHKGHVRCQFEINCELQTVDVTRERYERLDAVELRVLNLMAMESGNELHSPDDFTYFVE